MNTAEASWPHKSDNAINPRKRKRLFITLAVLGAFTVLSFNLDKIVNHFVTGHERDLLLPKMSALVAGGKPEAVVWMILNNPEFRAADPQYSALRKAAESGHPQSMYLYARFLAIQNDHEGAKAFLARAAAVGYPTAILALAEQAK